METTRTSPGTTHESRSVTTSSDTSRNDTYWSLKKRCDQNGISLSELCREAGIDRSILERWKIKNPKSIEMHNALLEALSRIESRNNIKSQ